MQINSHNYDNIRVIRVPSDTEIVDSNGRST